ncbi:MAG: alpha/beta hydrolase, partial [Acidobacteriota bacterium]
MLLDAHRLGLLCCAASLTIVLACGDSTEPPTAATPEPTPVTGELFTETIELESGETLEVDRGVIQVPIRRADASTTTLDLEFFRFHRSTDAPPDVPPVFQLRGGPGFGGLGPQLDDPGYYEHLLERYTRASDLVVVGQRGFGSSNATPCEPARALTVEEALDDDVRKQARFEAGQACRRHWEEQGLDLRGFTVVEAADDVIAVADFLGYDTIQLWGVSFGSHWGMTVLRRHPERVARATFSGLEGPDHTYDMPSGVLGAMELIAASAEAEPALGLPAEGLLAAYSKAIEAFDAEPVSLTVALDPEEIDGLDAAQTIEVTLDGSHLREMLAGSRRFTAFRHRS